MAIALVQSKQELSNATVAFASLPGNGNTIVVGVVRSGAAFANGDVTDTNSNTFTLVKDQSGNGGTDHGALFYAKNITATAGHLIKYPGLGSMVIVEYSGADQTSPLDNFNSGSGTSTTPSSGNVTVAFANGWLVGWSWSINNGTSWAAGSTPTITIRQSNIDNNTFERDAYGDVGPLSTGNYAATFTVGGSQAWLCVGATLKVAAATSGPAIATGFMQTNTSFWGT